MSSADISASLSEVSLLLSSLITLIYSSTASLSMTGWAFADAAEGKVATMFLEDYGTERFVSAYEKGCFLHGILTAWSMANAEKPVNADYRESCKGSRNENRRDNNRGDRRRENRPQNRPDQVRDNDEGENA